MRDTRWGALCFGCGVLALLAGLLLVAKNAHSNDGSPVGWLLVALGIFAVLGTVGILSGAFRED